MEVKIFVSSRLREGCKSWRKIAKGLLEAKGFTPILFEFEPPADQPGHIKEWWESKIKSSNFLILILNKTLSAAVFDEFKTAGKNNIKRLVFVKDEGIIKKEGLKLIDYPENGLIISRKEEKQFYHTIKNVLKYVPIKSEDQFMKDLEKGILQYDTRMALPKELWSYYIEDNNSELERIKEVYVKPAKIYDNAMDKLEKEHFLIIAGSPNVGKTSMAYYAASEIRDLINSDETPSGILKMGGKLSSEQLKNVKNFIILFDDVFGKSKAELYYAYQYDDIVKLKDKNFLILTSRENILNEIKDKRTRFTEFSESEISDLTIKIEQEGSYTDEDLEIILKNHLEYYLKAKVINEKEKEYALKCKGGIVRKLRFPHNYEEFVRVELKKILGNGISFDEAIDNAKHIKRVVKNWFLNLPDNEKYFVFTVAFFSGLNEEDFERVYGEVIKILQKNPYLINGLRKETSSYITETGVIDFKHPTYWEGVRDGIRDKFETELHKIIPILEKLIKDKDSDVRSKAVIALGVIGEIIPDKVLPILENLAKDKDSDVQLKAAIILRVIGEIIPDKVLPILEKLIRDKDPDVRFSTAFALGGIVRVAPDKALPILNKLAKDKDPDARSSAANSLGWVGRVAPDKVLPILEKLAKDKDSKVRSEVVIALRWIGKTIPDKVLPILENLAKDKDSDIRFNAVFIIGVIGETIPDKVLPILNKLAEDKDPNARSKAAIVLGEVGKTIPDKVLPILEKLIKDEDSGVRFAAMFAFEGVGRVAPDKVLPILEKLAKDKDSGVRDITEQFIKRLKKIR